MKILITGITGFIGSLLARKLLGQGHEIIGLVRSDAFKDNLIPNVQYITGDILNRESIRMVMRQEPDIVIHLAALTAVRKSFSNPVEHAETNYVGTINVVEEVKNLSHLKKFIFASTPEAYCSQTISLTENDRIEGQTPYGISKAAADQYVRYAGRAYKLPYLIIRHANSFGRPFELPEEARGYLVEKAIIEMISNNLEIKFDGSPLVKRSWIYYKDVIRAYELLINSDSKFEMYNFSSEDATVGGIVSIIREITNYGGDVLWNQNPRPFDPPSLIVDDSKARRELGWKPQYSIRRALEETVQYWKGRLKI